MEVQIQNVSHSFGTHSVLNKINLRFSSGSKVGLVGPNGSGKSTLMRVMMNLIHQDEGSISFSVPESSKSQKIFQSLKNLHFEHRRKLSYVPQIFPSFSSPLKDVVQTIAAIHHFSLEEFRRILNLFQLNLDSISDRPFYRLSGGMKQKVLLSLSFASKPDLILFDEPTSSLDPISRQIFYKMCLNLPKSTSIILCSHRIEEIRHLIQKVVLLEEGKVGYFGSAVNYLEQKTLCFLEVSIPSETKQNFLKDMGFSRSVSSWWYKICSQKEKLTYLSKLQQKFGNEIENIVIKDIDKESELID